MVLIEEEKLEAMFRRIIKEELIAILMETGKTMDFNIKVTVKKDAEENLYKREINLAKNEIIQPKKEITQKKQDPNYPPSPRLLNSLGELAEFLQISKPTAARLKNSGRFPYTKFGRKLIFNSEEVLKGVTVGIHDHIQK